MTLERTAYDGQSVVRVTLTACPAQNCGHEFDAHEARWKHYLDDHTPEDFGLSPQLVADGGEQCGRGTQHLLCFSCNASAPEDELNWVNGRGDRSPRPFCDDCEESAKKGWGEW